MTDNSSIVFVQYECEKCPIYFYIGRQWTVDEPKCPNCGHSDDVYERGELKI